MSGARKYIAVATAIIGTIGVIYIWQHKGYSRYGNAHARLVAQARGAMLSINIQAHINEGDIATETVTLDMLQSQYGISEELAGALRSAVVIYIPVSVSSPNDSVVFIVRQKRRLALIFKDASVRYYE